MRLFARLGRKRTQGAVDPNTPHKFRQVDDPGMGAAWSGAGGYEGGSPLGMTTAITGNQARDARCGVPGCGRDRDDAIHFPEG
jgi:hypothetical protein